MKSFRENLSKLKLCRRRRDQVGAFAALTVSLAFMVLVPLAVLAFELQHAQLVQKQLRVVSDAAALAAALAFKDSKYLNDSDKKLDAQAAAVEFVRRNNAAGKSFGNVQLVSSVAGAHPNAGDIQLAFDYDSSKEVVIINMAYGYRPTFANFLSLAPLLVNSKSNIGVKGKADVVIAVDVSGSMFNGSPPQPWTDEKNAIMNFCDILKSSAKDNVHMGMVIFAEHASGHAGADYRFTGKTVELSQTDPRYDEIKLVLSPINTNLGNTNTQGALEQAQKMITGPGHRYDADPYILLITDGLPTAYYSGSTAITGSAALPKALSQGDLIKVATVSTTPPPNPDGTIPPATPPKHIMVHSLGFFHGGTADMRDGKDFLDSLNLRANQSSAPGQVYVVDTIDKFKEFLLKMAKEDLGLVN